MSTYDWIDPFVKIEQLQQEIPRAEQRGERRVGDRVASYFERDFRRYGEQRARELARKLMERSIAPIRSELGEAMTCYALADRIANLLANLNLSRAKMTARVDHDGDIRFDSEVSYPSMADDYRRKGDLALQIAAEKAGWL